MNSISIQTQLNLSFSKRVFLKYYRFKFIIIESTNLIKTFIYLSHSLLDLDLRVICKQVIIAILMHFH